MALSTQDVDALRAVWEEWTAEKGFELSIKVRAAPEPGVLASGGGELSARLRSEPYCQVEIFKCARLGNGSTRRGQLVFSERVPHDAAALRASVSVLARTIAGYDGAS